MSSTLVEPLITDPVAPILADLAACLCSQIIADGLPAVCVCGVVPGIQASLDYAGDCTDACGQAWVRLITSYPSTIIGQPSERPGNCGTSIGIEVEMGIARCVDVGDGTNPPDPLNLAASAVLQSADMMAMWRAVACCRHSKDFAIGTYLPSGPAGGLVGGVLTLSILVT